MARSQGGRPDTEGAQREGTEKAWPLLFRASSHPRRVQFESDAGRHAGASWGEGGVVRLPRFIEIAGGKVRT